MKFIKALFVVLLATVSMNSFAQMVNMGDPGYPESNPADCSVFGTVANNFQDPGAAGNYPPNYT